MKTTLLSTLIFLWFTQSFAQSHLTHLVQNNSEDNLVKEIYFVRDAEREVREGTYQQFFMDSLITHGKYTNNKKTGLWEFFDYSNTLNFAGNYVDNRKDGEWVYYLNDNVSAKIYYNSGKTDSIFGYFENTYQACQVRKFEDGSGEIKTYYDNGKLKEVQPTQDGKPHGIFQIYFKNGQLHREVVYENGKMMTVLGTFDMAGNVIDGGGLKDGDGNLVTYYLSDTPEISPMKKCYNIGFNKATPEGICSHYYENGMLESSGFTRQAMTIGEWKYYTENGDIKHIINYDYSPFSEQRKQIKPEIYSGAQINTGSRIPEFQGGEDKWLNFLIQTVRYPNNGYNFPSLGIVYVDFVISDIGQIKSSRVVKSVNQALDNEALRVVEQMPRWNPGLRYGIPVSLIMNMPLSFNLE
jgi:TonB family protein